jgi:hypothetical protein
VLACWPVLAVAVVGAVFTGLVLLVAVRRARDRGVAGASWVAITPPAVMPPEGPGMLWRALTGLLSRIGRGGLAPRHVAMEFIADGSGMKVGIWVPASISASAVAQVVVRCWPGARAAVIRPPLPGSPRTEMTGAAATVEAVSVYPAGGGWAPLIDPARVAPGGVGRVEPLQSVLAALAERRGGDCAYAQLVVSLPRTAAQPTLASLPWQPAVRALVRAPFAVLFWVFDLLISPHNAHRRGAGPVPRTSYPSSAATDDPSAAAFRKTVAVKKAHGPHLLVTLRVALSSPAPQAMRRHVLGAIVNGYDLAAPQATLRTRRVQRPTSALSTRQPGRGTNRFVVTIAEAAALWHLPDQPSLYGITDASARVRRPLRDLPRFTTEPRQAHAGGTRSGRARPNHRAPTVRIGRDQWGPR